METTNPHQPVVHFQNGTRLATWDAELRSDGTVRLYREKGNWDVYELLYRVELDIHVGRHLRVEWVS